MSEIKMLPLPKWLLEGFTDPTIEKLCNYARAVAEYNVRSLTHELANAECVIDAEQAGRKKAEAEIEALRAENKGHGIAIQQLSDRAERLAEALREARDMVEDWAGYASEYFQDKHDLQGDLAKLDAALRDQEED